MITHKFVGGINKGWYLQVSVDANRTLVAQVKSKEVAQEWLVREKPTTCNLPTASVLRSVGHLAAAAAALISCVSSQWSTD